MVAAPVTAPASATATAPAPPPSARLSQGGGGGQPGPVFVCDPPPQPPTPRVSRDSGLGHGANGAPFFLVYASFFIKPSMLLSAKYRKTRHCTNVVCCEVLLVEISKTGRYTNVVCCEVKVLHSEQNPGPSAAPNSFWGERGTAFFLSFFLVSPSHALLRGPLSLG